MPLLSTRSLQQQTQAQPVRVTFAEDRSRIRKGNGPEVNSVFRRLALSIVKADTTVKDNIRGKRLIAGWNLDKLKAFYSRFKPVERTIAIGSPLPFDVFGTKNPAPLKLRQLVSFAIGAQQYSFCNQSLESQYQIDSG